MDEGEDGQGERQAGSTKRRGSWISFWKVFQKMCLNSCLNFQIECIV